MKMKKNLLPESPSSKTDPLRRVSNTDSTDATNEIGDTVIIKNKNTAICSIIRFPIVLVHRKK